jgi:hypothetical protein
MADNADLKAQYLAQVEADLERNTKEKERVAADLAALQEQLTVLEQDQELLVGVQQTLVGAAASTSAPVAESAQNAAGTAAGAPADAPVEAPAAVVPRARKPKAAAGKPKAAARTAKPAAAKPVQAKAAQAKPAQAKKTKAAKSGAGAAAKDAVSTARTLVDLVTAHLTGQGEPRSAAEVGTSLTQAHPDRKIQTTVVRNTLEALVAKGQALRSKQGRSVYYSSPEASAAPESAAAAKETVTAGA